MVNKHMVVLGRMAFKDLQFKHQLILYIKTYPLDKNKEGSNSL